jgi:hypothetical protein
MRREGVVIACPPVMLLIRESQMQMLSRDGSFGWMAAHLREFFPAECEALGAEGLDERIADGIGSAASYGFESQVHISQYLDLTFVLGPDFDTDPSLPWASAILSNPDLAAEHRMELLLETALASGQPR